MARRILPIIAWTFVGLALCVLIAAVAVPRLTGATPYVVTTSSMEPKLRPGSLVVVREIDPDKIEVGDVITFQLRSAEPMTATHRVVDVRRNLDGELQIRTQGDANHVIDPAVLKPVQIRGKVWYHLPWVGYVGNVIDVESKRFAERVLGIGFLAAAMAYFVQAAWQRTRSHGHHRSRV